MRLIRSLSQKTAAGPVPVLSAARAAMPGSVGRRAVDNTVHGVAKEVYAPGTAAHFVAQHGHHINPATGALVGAGLSVAKDLVTGNPDEEGKDQGIGIGKAIGAAGVGAGLGYMGRNFGVQRYLRGKLDRDLGVTNKVLKNTAQQHVSGGYVATEASRRAAGDILQTPGVQERAHLLHANSATGGAPLPPLPAEKKDAAAVPGVSPLQGPAHGVEAPGQAQAAETAAATAPGLWGRAKGLIGKATGTVNRAIDFGSAPTKDTMQLPSGDQIHLPQQAQLEGSVGLMGRIRAGLAHRKAQSALNEVASGGHVLQAAQHQASNAAAAAETRAKLRAAQDELAHTRARAAAAKYLGR